ncbi:MAG TPA: hypothetical protein VJZ76_15845 [Thermoanaerobaculia bacterium]|nr:hypothetical protein [Thermoanaerobaculia bacterium]
MEPLTALTDAVLAAWTAFLSALLFARGKVLWASAFAALAVAALAGTAYHCCRLFPKLVPIAIGLTSLFLGAAIAMAWLGPVARRIAIALLVVELIACAAGVMVMKDWFLVAVYDYLPVLVAVLIACIVRWRDPAARFIGAGIVVSFIALAFQMSRVPYHNDIYHVIQMAAMVLLYHGGARLRSPARETAAATPSSRRGR